MVYDQPDINELNKMITFCNKAKFLFIYGCEEKQKLLFKYLRMCSIKVDGFVITNRAHWEYTTNGVPIYTIDEINSNYTNKNEIYILLALPDIYYNSVLVKLQALDIKNIFFISEYNKKTIAYKMRPRCKEQFWVEVNLADHCNLNCQMCDHFSPLATPTFMNLDTFKKDVSKLRDLTNGEIGIFKLQGGEPLLNDDVPEYIRITRNAFPSAKIFLFTDGLLLKIWEHNKSENLWEVCHDYNVNIELTIYPIGLKVDELKDLSVKYNVDLDCFSEASDRNYQGVKHSVKHTFRLDGDVEPWQFISCYQFNESITLRNGKLYTCPMIPYIEHFNKYFEQHLKVSPNDYVEIHKAETFEELAEFMTHRTEFCKYCDIMHRRAFDWKQSKHNLNEYVDL